MTFKKERSCHSSSKPTIPRSVNHRTFPCSSLPQHAAEPNSFDQQFSLLQLPVTSMPTPCHLNPFIGEINLYLALRFLTIPLHPLSNRKILRRNNHIGPRQHYSAYDSLRVYAVFHFGRRIGAQLAETDPGNGRGDVGAEYSCTFGVFAYATSEPTVPARLCRATLLHMLDGCQTLPPELVRTHHREHPRQRAGPRGRAPAVQQAVGDRLFWFDSVPNYLAGGEPTPDTRPVCMAPIRCKCPVQCYPRGSMQQIR